VAALRAAGIEPDPALTVHCENTVEDAREAVVSLLRVGRTAGAGQPARPRSTAPVAAPFTAAIAFMPAATLGLLTALREQGLDVPRDVSVMGFGDAEWMRAYPPPITAIDQPNYEVGRRAASLLLRRIAIAEQSATDDTEANTPTSTLPSTPIVEYVSTRLIERASVL
jgi:DNA-binding LacI/PurR family transcriptional regulator